MDKNKVLQNIMSPAAEEGMRGNQPQTTTLRKKKRVSNMRVGLDDL